MHEEKIPEFIYTFELTKHIHIQTYIHRNHKQNKTKESFFFPFSLLLYMKLILGPVE